MVSLKRPRPTEGHTMIKTKMTINDDDLGGQRNVTSNKYSTIMLQRERSSSSSHHTSISWVVQLCTIIALLLSLMGDCTALHIRDERNNKYGDTVLFQQQQQHQQHTEEDAGDDNMSSLGSYIRQQQRDGLKGRQDLVNNNNNNN